MHSSTSGLLGISGGSCTWRRIILGILDRNQSLSGGPSFHNGALVMLKGLLVLCLMEGQAEFAERNVAEFALRGVACANRPAAIQTLSSG